MSGVGIVPKVALTTARIAHKPFEVPTQLTNSALVTAGATYNFIGKSTQAARESYEALQPRGPAKLMLKLFDTADAATAKSIGRADTNTKVLWKPLSESSEQVGQAVVTPLAAFYAGKAGFPEPSNPDLIRELLHTKGYPKPAAAADPGTTPQQPTGTPDPATTPVTPTAAPDVPTTPTAAPDVPTTPTAAPDAPTTPTAGAEVAASPTPTPAA